MVKQVMKQWQSSIFSKFLITVLAGVTLFWIGWVSNGLAETKANDKVRDEKICQMQETIKDIKSSLSSLSTMNGNIEAIKQMIEKNDRYRNEGQGTKPR